MNLRWKLTKRKGPGLTDVLRKKASWLRRHSTRA
jgi:hypothetical protein